MTTVPLADLMAKNTLSRFAVLEAPIKTPGVCAVCGSPHRPVMDVGLNITRYGWVMFCLDCVKEMGLRIGLVLASDVEEASLQAGQSIEDYLNARNLRVVTNEFYDTISVAFDAFVASVSASNDSISPVVDGETKSSAQGEFEFDGDNTSSSDAPSSDDSEQHDVTTSGVFE